MKYVRNVLKGRFKIFHMSEWCLYKISMKGSKRLDISLNSTMFVLYNDVIFVKKDKTAVNGFKMMAPGYYQFTTNGLRFYPTATNNHQ